ncbi:uncharacterized protein Z518_06889 [Rhinocladiella mackenziei CBS 650.93]|uniref:Uncharacterized protein n=1 Tax=Rhinocladiella mackenziei CBS 650.93 TaxID=1442369 RepID=A0A0D2FMR6_9EURO|nr:uncharacterized protein Z518_06889 [Rhinocladiella mackenziei CBS 650.93]KIX03337.1 hypothetical protein Z518_06889 [Rhinocladiella mackenziei CBS 650.93]
MYTSEASPAHRALLPIGSTSGESGMDALARMSLETLRRNSIAPKYIELEWDQVRHGVEEEKKKP